MKQKKAINFFNPSLITSVSDSEFGLCDPGNLKPAFVDHTVGNPNWIATVKNPKHLSLSFVPIDNGVLTTEDPEKSDVMLFLKSFCIYFIELKNKMRSAGAAQQLENIIKIFIQHHGKEEIDACPKKHRRAYVCNKKHPQYKRPHHEGKLAFHKLGVRLYMTTTILVT